MKSCGMTAEQYEAMATGIEFVVRNEFTLDEATEAAQGFRAEASRLTDAQAALDAQNAAEQQRARELATDGMFSMPGAQPSEADAKHDSELVPA